MSTMFAARAARQTVVLAAIAGLHIGAFILIGMGLGANLRLPALPDPPIKVFVPPPKPLPLVAPGRVPDLEYRIPAASKPDIQFPVFEERNLPTPEIAVQPGNAAAAGPAESAVDDHAPGLRTRDRRLAALIDACYPSASRRLAEAGRVVARVTIDATGRPVAWSIEKTSGFVHLDAGADCVIRQLKFFPGRRDGRGVEATVLLPIAFRLR